MAEKLPYFPLYVDAFDTDDLVIPMSYEAEGVYNALLRFQWRHGTVPDDLRSALPKAVSLEALEQVRPCFTVLKGSQPSRSFNPKLERIREKVSRRRKKQSEGGREGGIRSGLSRRSQAEARLEGKLKLTRSIASSYSSKAVERSNHTEVKDKPSLPPPTHEEEFKPCWMTYPKRAGSNSRADALQAFTRRRKEGVTAEEMLAGTRRYAGFVADTGKIGTEFVMQAVRFYGPSKHYTESWELSAEASRLTPKQREEQASLEWVEQREKEKSDGN